MSLYTDLQSLLILHTSSVFQLNAHNVFILSPWNECTSFDELIVFEFGQYNLLSRDRKVFSPF